MEVTKWLKPSRRKGRQTDMLNLTPPRHTPTLRKADQS